MNVLTLDTSTDRGAIGLSLGSGAVFMRSIEGGRRHGRDLIPAVVEMVRAAGISVRDVGVLGVGVGPGSYTGLRVGLTAAKTLAFATGASLVGFDSLHAIAYNAPTDASSVSVVADAQRGQVYVAEFLRQPSGRLNATRSVQIEPLDAWIERLDPTTVVLGPALDSPRIRSTLPAGLLLLDSAWNYPTGQWLVELACEAWSSGHRDDPWVLEPRYLRQSSAEEQWNTRARTSSETDTPASS